MSRHLILAFGLLAAAAAPGTVAAAPVDLLSHRAAYRLSLKDAGSSGSESLQSVRGALVLEWQADCSGWLSQQRLGFVAKTSEGSDFSYDVRFSSWEAADDTKLRFQVRSFDSGKETETFGGAAALTAPGGTGEARYTSPGGNRIDLPAGTLFPTGHVRHLIESARAGERLVDDYVFDGSGPDALNKVTAVIGQPKAVRTDTGGDERRWPIRLAYFGTQKQDETPQFQIGFDLSDRGVLNDIVLNYGDFALRGELEKLEALGEPKCD